MKLLPNINKPVPEASDPPLIKPVSDAIEAIANLLGAPVTDLTTTAKTIVPAINELAANISLIKNVVQKYPDGTMIIEGVASVTGAITVAWGTSLFYANFTLDFPGQFHSVENMIATISSLNSALVMGALPSLSYATIILARPMNTPSQTYDVSYRVKGRWKA